MGLNYQARLFYMEENIKKRNFTNAEFNVRLDNKIQACTRTLNTISNVTGISLDLMDRLELIRFEINKVQQEKNKIWTQITQTNQVNQVGTLFDQIDEQINGLYENVNALYEESLDEQYQTKRIRVVSEIDKSEFEKARNFHRSQANKILILLGFILVFSLFIILYIFNYIKWLPINNIVIQNNIPNNSDLYHYIVQFGGKISILFGLGWLMKFLGSLHSSHAEQAVSYQDRLAGISVSELIITSGRSTVREKILLEMADTYLTLKQNAFRHEKIETNKEEFEFTYLEKLGNALKSLGLFTSQK